VGYGWLVTIPETTLIFAGIPVLVTTVIASVSVLTAAKKPRPPEYRVGQPWTLAPLMWTASDEVVPRGGGHAHVGEGDSDNLIGGIAHGQF
jgi:hypothetical protein